MPNLYNLEEYETWVEQQRQEKASLEYWIHVRGEHIDTLKAENARLKAELAAIKARTCETRSRAVPDDGALYCCYLDTYDGAV